MSWVLPVPLLLFAGAVALLPLVSLVHRPTPAPRLGAEAVITASAVIAFIWLGWVRLWLIEQRRCAAARPASWPRMTLRVPRAAAQAGGDPTLRGRATQNALRLAIATRPGSRSWDLDHAKWVVTLPSQLAVPERS